MKMKALQNKNDTMMFPDLRLSEKCFWLPHKEIVHGKKIYLTVRDPFSTFSFHSKILHIIKSLTNPSTELVSDSLGVS